MTKEIFPSGMTADQLSEMIRESLRDELRMVDEQLAALQFVTFDWIADGTGDVGVIDLATGQTTARWPTQSERPTNVAFDARGAAAVPVPPNWLRWLVPEGRP